ncbi:MAG: hypothetical protein IT449_08540 [Phycisphaerales bacterium]|nr:hypothetical protein [Phycisphaerales bacterium]
MSARCMRCHWQTCAAMVGAIALGACSRPSPPSTGSANGQGNSHEPSVPSSAKPAPNAKPAPDAKPSRALPIAVPDPAEADRWLHVVRVREGVPGGVATGDFDPQRNKITIATTGVLEFRMDTDLMSIDWSRSVVLRIDGYNSQLVPRDEKRLTFRVNETGDWMLLTK